MPQALKRFLVSQKSSWVPLKIIKFLKKFLDSWKSPWVPEHRTRNQEVLDKDPGLRKNCGVRV